MHAVYMSVGQGGSGIWIVSCFEMEIRLLYTRALSLLLFGVRWSVYLIRHLNSKTMFLYFLSLISDPCVLNLLLNRVSLNFSAFNLSACGFF